MVSVHCELCHFFFNDEIVEPSLVWEFIAEAESVVIKTETDSHLSVG